MISVGSQTLASGAHVMTGNIHERNLFWDGKCLTSLIIGPQIVVHISKHQTKCKNIPIAGLINSYPLE